MNKERPAAYLKMQIKMWELGKVVPRFVSGLTQKICLKWITLAKMIFDVIIMKDSLPNRLEHEINKEVKTYLYREK